MKPPWSPWLASWRRRTAVHGRCLEAAREGAALFPELRVAAGYALTIEPEAVVAIHQGLRDLWSAPGLGGGTHAWLVAPDGRIVDPTERQFGRVVHYVEVPGAAEAAVVDGRLSARSCSCRWPTYAWAPKCPHRDLAHHAAADLGVLRAVSTEAA